MTIKRIVSAKERAHLKALGILREKHKGKTRDQITNADAMEYLKERMAKELNL